MGREVLYEVLLLKPIPIVSVPSEPVYRLKTARQGSACAECRDPVFLVKDIGHVTSCAFSRHCTVE